VQNPQKSKENEALYLLQVASKAIKTLISLGFCNVVWEVRLSATIKDTAASATNDIGKVIVAIFKIEHGTLTSAVNQDPAGAAAEGFSQRDKHGDCSLRPQES